MAVAALFYSVYEWRFIMRSLERTWTDYHTMMLAYCSTYNMDRAACSQK